MNTKFFTSIVTIFFLLCSSTASICLGKEYITEEDIWTSNINDKAINIKVTDICTCHNTDVLFSHRGHNGKRGNLGAFLSIV